jgi:predicted Zn-dependent protease
VSYENPPQPEGINITRENPLREFFAMLLVVVVAAAVVIAGLAAAASWLAERVPYELELKVTEGLGPSMLPGVDGTATEPELLEREAYLRALGGRLLAHMDFPPEIVPRIYYVPGETVNAYASLGGQVVLFEGLVSKLPSENALALVLAHELAHIKLRHPVVAAGRGLTVSLALGAVFGLSDNGTIARLVDWVGVTSTLSFSRAQERAADELAAAAVLAEYGHLQGARGLFDLFSRETGGGRALLLEFQSTHPDIDRRIAWLEALASKHAPASGGSAPITPLPWAVQDMP